MGFGGDFRKNEKKKLSKEQLEKKAKKLGNKNPTVFKLPELIRKDK